MDSSVGALPLRHRSLVAADERRPLPHLPRNYPSSPLTSPVTSPSSKPAVALIWDDATRLGGVNTWLFQCVDRLPSRGLDAWVVDLGESECGQVQVSRWRNRILTLRRTRWESARAFRLRLRREFTVRNIQLLLFQEHRFGEDVLDALPPGFPAANVLHIDRPDPRYYRLAAELDPRLAAQFCVSPRIRDTLLPHLPSARHAHIHYLPLGVELPPSLPPRPLGGPLHLVYAGRIVQAQKRVRDLAPFLAALDAAHLDWELDVYGGGAELETLRADLQPWSASGRARVHGSVPQEEVGSALAQAHVLLLFSDFEGLPLVLLEAMARSVVPVVTRVPSGVSEILAHNRDALLFAIGDTADAARQVLRLSREPGLFNHLADGARRTAAGFDLEPCLDAYAAKLLPLASPLPSSNLPSVFDSRPRSWRARLADVLPSRHPPRGAFSA